MSSFELALPQQGAVPETLDQQIAQPLVQARDRVRYVALHARAAAGDVILEKGGHSAFDEAFCRRQICRQKAVDEELTVTALSPECHSRVSRVTSDAIVRPTVSAE